MNEPKKQLYVYLEDAPAVETCPATGLSKALIPLLREVSSRTSFIQITQTHQHLDQRDILEFGVPNSVSSKLHYFLARVSTKLPFRIANAGAWLHGTWLGLTHRRRAAKGQRMVLWAAIGVDPLSLTRARAFSAAVRLPFEAYLVDDIETHPSNAGKSGLHAAMRRALRSAAQVYTITVELGARFQELYGVETNSLPLTANIPIAPWAGPEMPEFFAAYLGGINHLYEDGLKLLVEMVSELRGRTGKNLTIRVISAREAVARILDGGVPDWIVCGSEDSADGLAAALAGSQFCYLPYSHRESARIMVRSSFPSKLLDYFASARQIVVFAPAGSVPHALFEREALAFATTSADEMRQRLEQLVDSTDNQSPAYRGVLDRHHGRARASSIIFGKA
jgi:hypothetical protein